MLDKLRSVADRYEELCFKSEQPDFYSDPQKAAKLLREKNDLEPIVDAFHAYNGALQEMADAQELMADPEMKEFCQETYQAAKAKSEELYRQLQILLLPKDPNDEKALSWRSGAVSAVRKVPCLPIACSGCIPCMPRKWAGRLN